MADQLHDIVTKMVAAGEPEENIALVIKHYKSAQPPTAPAAPEKPGYLDSGGGMFGEGNIINGVIHAAKAAWSHPVQTGAILGGIAAAPATGGASIPVSMAAAGLGAAGGAGIGSIVNALRGGENGPTTAAGVAQTMGKEGALGAAGEGAGQLVSKGLRIVGPKLQQSAVSAYGRMLKPNKATLEGMPGMGRNLEERAQNVASELINDPNGQISKTGASQYADATSAIKDKVNAIVDANPEARGSTSHLTDELNRGRGTFENQWAPSGDTSAYDRVSKDVLNNPRITKNLRTEADTSVEHALGLAPGDSEVRVTGRVPIPRIRAATARDLTQGTYRNLGDSAYGELKGAEVQANKAAARGGRAILNEALPEVEPLNNQISKRIDLGQVLDEAVLRSGKHDPVGLSQQVILSGGHLGFLPASLINRPGIGSPIARGVNDIGSALTGAGKSGVTADAVRSALLALFGGQ